MALGRPFARVTRIAWSSAHGLWHASAETDLGSIAAVGISLELAQLELERLVRAHITRASHERGETPPR